MRQLVRHFVALAVLLAWVLPAQAEEPASVRRVAFIIGVNDGGKERVRLRYAETDARTMANVLETLGGVSGRDRFLLLNPSKSEVLNGIEHVRGMLTRADGAAKRTELFVYYSGHSDEEALLIGEERIGYGDLRHAIDSLPADVRVVVLDSCASGAMTRQKGGIRRAPLLIDESTKVQGRAIITSSSENEAAQESDRVGGSFFTHFLVSGLRGAADTSHDGRVTLNEAYQFAFNETLARTEQTQAGAQHPAYDFQLVGTGDLVMTDLRGSSARLVLPAQLDGRVYVRDQDGKLAAELRKLAGRPVELGLEAGTYDVTVATANDVLGMQVSLSDGRRTEIASTQMKKLPKEWAVARGGKFVDPPLEVAPQPVEGARPASEYTDVPAVASVLPGISTAMGISGKVSTKAALNVPFGRVDRVDGIQLGFVSWVSDDFRGLDLTVAASIVGENMHGVQTAAGLNVAGGEVMGAQLASGFNIGAKEVTGAQLSAGFNIARGDLTGIQGAAGFNYAGSVTGAQLSLLNVGGDVTGAQVGVLNIAKKVTGTQIGLLNIADDVDGVPIGLISYSKTGMLHLDVWTSTMAKANVSLKIGSKHFYTLVTGSYGSPLMDCGCSNFQLPYVSVGLGTHVPFWKLYVDFDVSGGYRENGNDSVRTTTGVVQARASLGWQPFAHFGVFGGVSANVAITRQWSRDFGDVVPLSGKADINDFSVYPGFFAGLQF